MEFDTLNLFLNVLFSAIGLGYFVYGKRQRQGPALLAGLLLMIYPYFVSNTLGIVGAGLTLIAAPFLAKRMGW
ncbi:MAG TPA: amino acid transport protein [Nitrospiria bacterium]|nr:amino acid transport protein [Nitrospiria bacterium]